MPIRWGQGPLQCATEDVRRLLYSTPPRTGNAPRAHARVWQLDPADDATLGTHALTCAALHLSCAGFLAVDSAWLCGVQLGGAPRRSFHENLDPASGQ